MAETQAQGETTTSKETMPKGTYKFPLERVNDYKGVMTFRPIKYTPPEIQGNILGSTFKNVTNGLRQFSETLGLDAAATLGLDPSVRANVREGTDYPKFTPNANQETIITKAHSDVDYSRGVQLYLPQQIQFNDVLQYDGSMNLGPIGAIGLTAMQQGQNAGSALYRGASQAVTSMVGLLTGEATSQRAARLAATRLAETLPIGEAGAGAVKAGMGVTVNPNTINLFKSVSLREFQFTFKLIASSYQESVSIENIIKFFRTTAYPDTINFDDPTGGFSVPIGYEFPDKFEITMTYNNKQVGLKFLPSVLRNIQVTYNPGSMGWHREGHASEVDLSLNFGEERTLTKNDIFKGY
tara:strand:- start:1398 stop:2456 length:1059 start_codon:yes stop_codon:yes gene_type:complete